jgi:hypothetical protein
MKRILIAYYSRTGTTRGLAMQLASAFGEGVAYDLEAIQPATRRSGLLGWIRCAIEGKSQRAAEIAPSQHDPASYDAVLVGTPTWAQSLSGPARAYLHRHRRTFPTLGFFCTAGGEGSPAVFAQMAAEAARDPAATILVRQTELESAATRERVARMVAVVEEAITPTTTARPTPRSTQPPAAN